jgi:hypothetical protein
LPQMDLLADDTKGRGKGVRAYTPPPNGLGLLWDGMHTPRSGIFLGTNYKIASTLWMPLQHWSSDGSINQAFITELGISAQSLGESFLKYGKWITHTWLKSLWENVDKFDITVEIAPIPIEPPRMGDKWFMQAVIEAGYKTPEELTIINRFQCHQQVIHVSDILDAGGRCLDKKYLSCRWDDKLWSTNYIYAYGKKSFLQSPHEGDSRIG